MTAELLDASSDLTAWHDCLAELPEELQDTYFYPEYITLHVSEDSGHRAVLFVYRRDGETWAYPFLLIPVPALGADGLGAGAYDIETAYGYGGPLSTSSEPGFLEEAHAAFSQWCAGAGVVAEFIRFHALVPGPKWVDPRTDVRFNRHTRSMDLAALGQEPLPFHKKTRAILRRADRLGLRYEPSDPGQAFQSFKALYLKTMTRLGADAYYDFSEAYFQGLERLVRAQGWLVCAWEEEQLIAGAIFLRGERWLHYHLSATEPDRRLPGVTNRIIYTAAELGREYGLERLHLGGGNSVSEDDPLYRFKSKMSTDSHDFFVGTRVHDEQLYGRLRARWQETFPQLVTRYGNRLLCYHYHGENSNA